LQANTTRYARCSAGLERPYLLMPGNHDDRERLARCFPEHAYLPANGPKHYVIDRHAVRIVALDTTVPGHHHGEVDEAGLAWLATTLAATQGAPTVVLMHHPPIACGIPYLDKYMCRRPERIAEVIGRFGNVERVLCGHVHRPILQRWAGTLLCSCPSTADTNCTPPSVLTPSRPPSASRRPACFIGGATASWSRT